MSALPAMMTCIEITKYGGPEVLVPATRPVPRPKAGEILIKVAATAVNRPDIAQRMGNYAPPPGASDLPGLEAAGTVAELGDGVSGWTVGDEICALTPGGSYAEYCTVPAPQCLPPPKGFDLLHAAALPENYFTVWHNLFERGQLKAGETLLVLGASGGVGLAAVELGKMLGARVIACASTTEKLEVCKRAGADDTINYETENLREAIKRLTQDRGLDVVYDPVGDKFADPAVRGLAWGGRYLVVGFAAGEIPKVALNLPLLKGGAIVGVWWGGLIKNDPAQARRLTQELVNLIADGRLKPLISATYPLAKTGDALADLMARKVTGKIVVVTGDA